MQGRRAVAAVHTRPCPVVVSAVVVGCAVPRVAQALRHRFLGVGRLQDGQVQRHHTVAACDGGEGLRVNAAGCIDFHQDIAVKPLVVFAFCGIYLKKCTAGDGQMQRIDLQAAVVIFVGVGVVAGFRVGLPVSVCPGVAATFRDGDRGMRRVVDGQVKGRRAVTAVHACPCPVVISAGVVGCAVPWVAQTLRHRFLGVGRLQDGQVQRHHTVAACDGGEGLRVNAAFCIDIEQGFAVIPRVVLAFRIIYLRILTAGNGQMQCIHLRAAVDILMGISVVARGCVGFSVNPSERDAILFRISLMLRIVDGQMQRIHLRAAVGILMGISVVARGRVGSPVNPSERAASLFRVGLRCRVVDGQVQRHHTVAPVGRAAGNSVSGGIVTLGVGIAVNPGVAAASRLYVDAGGVVADGEVEGIDLQTTVRILVGVSVVAALQISRAIPGVALACGFRHGGMLRVVDGQVQRHHTVAPVGRTAGNSVGGGIVALSVGIAVNPSVAAASRRHVDAGGVVADGEVEGVDLRATVGICMGVSVVAAMGIGRAVPGVRLASSLSHGCVDGIVDGQVQRHHTVAPVGRTAGNSVGGGTGALGVGDAVNPGVAAACRPCVNAGGGIEDGEVEGIDLHAAVCIFVGVSVFAALGISLPVAIAPGVAAALRGGDSGVDGIVDGEVQRIDLQTAVSILVLIRVLAAFGISRAAPSVRLTLGFGVSLMLRMVDDHLHAVRPPAARRRGRAEKVPACR